jgi:Extensin-like protein C-terminus
MVQIGGGSDKAGDQAFAPPQRLGGPKAKTTSADVRLDFLRGVHAAACRRFGTVLGPEANHAHKNHFHIDMAQRAHGTICE